MNCLVKPPFWGLLAAVRRRSSTKGGIRLNGPRAVTYMGKWWCCWTMLNPVFQQTQIAGTTRWKEWLRHLQPRLCQRVALMAQCKPCTWTHWQRKSCVSLNEAVKWNRMPASFPLAELLKTSLSRATRLTSGWSGFRTASLCNDDHQNQQHSNSDLLDVYGI